MNHWNRYSRWSRYIGISILFAGLLLLLGTVLMCDMRHLIVGEQAYQRLCLGYAAIAFAVCALIYCCFIRSEKHSSVFYMSAIGALILVGGVEAVWGLRQIYGFASSNHALYSLTGSFYNPGPYSGYLAMVFPVCLSEWLNLNKKENRTWIEQGLYYIVAVLLLMILCVLPAGMSRSAWIAAIISGVWVYGMHDSWVTRLKSIGIKYKKRIIPAIIVGGVLLIIVGYALFHLKANSASGRLFMWKISSMAMAEQPFTGHGTGSFAEAYGQAQENYFARGDYADWEELVAGSPEYAFNEYLQVAVEYGIPVLLLILSGIGFCLWKGVRERCYAACGGVISFLVFAFSSYPLQIPGFAIAFCVLLAACVIGCSRWLLLLFAAMMAWVGVYNIRYNQYEDGKKWASCRMLYNVGAYGAAKEGYEKLYLVLNDRGAFLFEYGHSLHRSEEYEASNKILKEAEKFSSDPMVLNIIGKNYQGMGKYEEAERWLIRSTNRLPGRIYPYYLLVKLYAEPGFHRPDRLQQMADKVLTKEPKVQSTAVREMRAEVKKILETINN